MSYMLQVENKMLCYVMLCLRGIRFKYGGKTKDKPEKNMIFFFVSNKD